MKPFHLPTRVAAVLLGAALIASTGCDLFDPDRRNLSVSLYTEAATPVAQLHATAGTKRVVLLADADGERSKQVVAPRDALLRVRVTLLDVSADTLADVIFDQVFASRDDEHWIAASVGRRRPAGHCIGTLVVAPLSAGSDSLYLTYGHIPRDAIC